MTPLQICFAVGLSLGLATARGQGAAGDWLLGETAYPARLIADTGRGTTGTLTLDNGLVRRTFRLRPNVVCTDFTDEINGQQLVRAVSPEARLILDGKPMAVGGVYGQKERAYLEPATLARLKDHREDAHSTGWDVGPLQPYLHWEHRTWTGNPRQPAGITLTFHYVKDAIRIDVHYALYDGLPLICKWLVIRNTGARPVRVDRVVNEVLATPEEESAVVGNTDQMARPQGLYVESNYAFDNAMRYDLSDQATHWEADSTYTSQVNYNYKTPCLLEVYPVVGPGVILGLGDTLESIRTFELLMDSYDRERRGLAIRKMYRTIAPWTTQNPIFMHLVSRTDEDVRRAIGQCDSTGYEALIMSFGSHCDMEDTSAANLARWKALADLAHSKGILVGGYSLFSSRHISDSDDVISPLTGKPGGAFFGYAPCFGSRWGLGYLKKIETFLARTGFDLFENDGPYPGDLCASTRHPGHRGLEDSQWEQMQLQKSLYHWCNEHGIYVNAPDWYFLDGTNKIALGYREVNFSLPRDEQVILNRQNIFDGTWEKTPSMGWGFVPLTKYQGGGPEAVLEPLKDHLKDYRQLMVQYYGAGVQACYRGPRLYDCDSTRRLVSDVIAWYKRYRSILNADIIHLRRPDGRDWDGILHVDPKGTEKGFLLLYNPLDTPITRTIRVPLYYTGITRAAGFHRMGGDAEVLPLDRDYGVTLTTVIPAGGYIWYTID